MAGGRKGDILWSVEQPVLCTAVCRVISDRRCGDEDETPLGTGSFTFGSAKCFLNRKPMKILGVETPGSGLPGTAGNSMTMERQRDILTNMGASAIRASHNRPAPELLDLCDRMRFLVIDEALHMGKKPKAPYTTYGHSLWWDEWRKHDLDVALKDPNHPRTIIWSIGDEGLDR
ncbi:MAG: glycoside hydrolase family 2 TIM barrel-domain containing protein [Candidatus Oleimicrobiaceae bacterium]